MQYSRQHPALLDLFTGFALYADLSQATLTARHNLVPNTIILHNHKILYKWGFPAKLLVEMHNESHSITQLEKDMEIVQKWCLLPMNGDFADPEPFQDRRNNNRQNRRGR